MSPTSSHRHERVADLIRGELATIIRQEIKDPRVGLATVSHLRLARDFSHATVGISVLGDDEAARNGAVEALHHARGFLRSQLARRVRLRTVPVLEFKLDRGAEHSQRISDLLENLHGDDERS